MTRIAVLAVTAGALLVSCAGDPTAATEENILSAVNARLAENSCVELPSANPPGTQLFPILIDARGSELMEDLAKAGALTARPTPMPPIAGIPMRPGTAYELTARGREVIYTKTIRRGNRDREVAELCLGRFKVTGIDSFTEPADTLGHKVTRVKFRYRLADYPSWAPVSLVGDEDMHARMTLAATNDGWVDLETLH